MPNVRIAGQVLGREDPSRKARAKLLYHLFEAGWNIYNGNGDQEISLLNVQQKIIESDAFIFTPKPTLSDMFNAASVFVGHQTNDEDLDGKSTVLLNSDGSWDAFIKLMHHLHDLGTVRELPEEFLDIVERPRQVAEKLEEIYDREPLERKPAIELKDDFALTGTATRPDYSVCVFCSASIRKEPYINDGYKLGKMLADNNIGCISGAGSTGIMGAVVKGCGENGGWAAGSNVPHIIAMEGLPKELSAFWSRPDIYTRMEIMIKESDAFVIMPGGIGTIQEMFALVVLGEQNNPLMTNKPIIVVNRTDEDSGEKFWSPFIRLLNDYGIYKHFAVVDTVDEILPKLQEMRD